MTKTYLIRKVRRIATVYEIWDPQGNRPEYVALGGDNGTSRNGSKVREMQDGKIAIEVVESFRELTPVEIAILADLPPYIKDE